MSNINNQNYQPDHVEFTGAPAPAAKTGGFSGGFVPIEDGSYNFRLTKGKNGVNIKRSQAGNDYVEAHVVGTVADGPKAGKKQSFWLNGFPDRFTDKETGVTTVRASGIEMVCRYAGINLLGQISNQETVQYLEQALAQEPIGNIGTQWVVTARMPSDKNPGKTYNKTLLKGMKSFPQNADGTYNPTVEIDGVTYEAKLKLFFHEGTASANGAA